MRNILSSLLLEHFDHPRCVGTLDNKQPGVGMALRGAGAKGEDGVQFFIKINAQQVIETSRFLAYGGPVLIATSSYVAALLCGLTVEQALALDSRAWQITLEIPQIRISSVMLVEDAMKAAVFAARSSI